MLMTPSTLSGSGIIPVSVMQLPTKSRELHINLHLAALTTRPYCRSFSNSSWRCCLCLGILTHYEYIINRDEYELEVMTDCVHELLEGLSKISCSPMVIQRNSYNPNGVSGVGSTQELGRPNRWVWSKVEFC